MDNARKRKAKEFILARGKYFHPDFKLDRNNGKAALQLFQYFSGDKSFEEELDCYGQPMTFKKGIMLMSGVGTGKTWLMETFSNRAGIPDMLNGFYFNSCRSIVTAFNQKGMDELIPMYDKTRCFDDIGSETIPGMHYGTKINVMYDIIMSRYEYFHKGLITHFTTNIGNGKMFDDLYGEARVASRLREMVNFITIDGTDRRK